MLILRIGINNFKEPNGSFHHLEKATSHVVYCHNDEKPDWAELNMEKL
jgi:hypothetical protein